MPDHHIEAMDLVWALGSCCALEGRPFDAELLLQQSPPPHTMASLVKGARDLGLRAGLRRLPPERLAGHRERLVLRLRVQGGGPSLGLLLKADANTVTFIPAGSHEPVTQDLDRFAALYAGDLVQLQREPETAADPDQAPCATRFGLRWFVPELLKHRKVWRDVLGASLLLQLLALGLPLFTQAIIDKVVVHRTETTLVAIAAGMAIFLGATATFSWVRQYLVLHTGNRVDAVLASHVFAHLLRLPPRYFQHRPTGVIAARLHGVETIREFVSSAAITLVLDAPFLLIALAVMLHYSLPLTLVALAVLALIAAVSAGVAPLFQARLNEQFLQGARNQAFLTEYIAGIETVKSLQFEPQLQARYGEYLASYLHAGFRTRQLANSYQVAATTLEQLMTILILLGGAWIVMHPEAGSREVFTIGMLVAFQMFAGKLSQPLMRLVGLWQQFQQARLAVLRLADLMDVPVEPYSLVPSRQGGGAGRIEIEGLAFRHGDDRPWLFEGLDLTLEPGQAVAVMGPSGCGKSTLAKLLQGFWQPQAGQIRIDGIDIRHLGANELRAHFGVVPQETVLFSGTVLENLVLANAHATFEQVMQACRMAGIHDAIEALPQGYQTPIGERGVGLSGGQRQRLAIARALLKRPRVLVFDEATSALDAETAELFARTINGLKGRVTMLFITHALPRGLRVDEVIALGRQGARALHAVAPAAEAAPPQ